MIGLTPLSKIKLAEVTFLTFVKPEKLLVAAEHKMLDPSFTSCGYKIDILNEYWTSLRLCVVSDSFSDIHGHNLKVCD